ncbi:glycosyl hydrolase family 18 protein [Patescibacteria group bacterium]|nr:glycosyl hydrolase family 18 protein [Patescibacteria group bacterium]MCL5410169.1 glycosyl hydrolase family 18 protein [Patescibacteria group bacterium]
MIIPKIPFLDRFRKSSPTVPVVSYSGQNYPTPTPQEQELGQMKRLMEFNLGLSMVLGGVVLFVVIFVVAWRANLLGHFQQNSPSAPSAQTLVDNSQPRLAAPGSGDQVVISDQVIEPGRIFQSTPYYTGKLTLNGQIKKDIFGYLPYWMVDQSDQIDIRMLTMISFFGLEVDGNGNVVKSSQSDKDTQAWQTWQDDQNLDQFILKAKKNRIKVFLTLKCFNNDNITKLAQSPDAAANFIHTALYLMNSKSLDGLNIDFEYVGTPDQKIIDGFSILMSNLNKEMKRQYPKSMLTINTYLNSASVTTLEDVEMLAQNSDALVVMGYDVHTPASSQAGPLAPMEGYNNSVVGLMSSYLEKVPAEKLILAFGYYGYDWPVSDASQNSQVNKNSSDVGVYSYAEIADASQGMKINWDENAQSPWYSYVDPKTGQIRVVHYENARSLGIKYDFVNQKHLRGVGIWALGYDGKNTDLEQLLADKFANQ